MDEGLSGLFQEWLAAFETVQRASADESIWKADALREIESRIATTPADGLQGLIIKLALHCFLHNHAEASSQTESVYRDLVRMTGNDPLVEIAARFKKSA